MLLQTTLSLAASATSALLGSSTTLTAAVVGNQGSGIPTGSITFVANGASIGTAKLASGVAVLNASALSFGLSSVQAQYGGDTSYAASASNSTQIQVYGDFALTASAPAAETLARVRLQALISFSLL